MGTYLRPNALDAALQALSARDWTILAGGTDFYPARVGRHIDEDILDITAIAELQGIAEADDHIRIGATTTWSDVIAADLPPSFRGLQLAAREVGGIQVQNAGHGLRERVQRLARGRRRPAAPDTGCGCRNRISV